MRKTANNLIFSASDLSNHIQCKHLTNLNFQVLEGMLKKEYTHDRTLELIREKGLIFEEHYLNELENLGLNIYKVDKNSENAEEETRKAISEGFDIIYQAKLAHEEWQGWADFLRKVPIKSNLGEFSYEIVDTKLSTQNRAGNLLQITLYSEILATIQGILPEFMFIKNPEEEIQFRVNDYIAYLRLVKNNLSLAIQDPIETYPEPCNHCDLCDWWQHCNAKRREEDHISFVAGVTKSQTKELKNIGIDTLEDLATIPLPENFRPKKGSKESFNKIKEQAQLQKQTRDNGIAVYEVDTIKNGFGLTQLPPPSKGDIYLKFEGDPLIEPNGLEFLMGWHYQNQYFHQWVKNTEEEKETFITLINFIESKKLEFPDLHLYHFSHYENTSLKRLMSKYAVKEKEIDNWLRSDTFFDLSRIVKQSIKAGVEKYSLKELEVFYNFERTHDFRKVVRWKSDLQFLLESKKEDFITSEMREILAKNNEEDCLSIKEMHFWLERERQKLIDAGNPIARPEEKENIDPEHVSEHLQRINPIIENLLKDIPLEIHERNNLQQAKYLLAHLVDWYRREEKSFWWEYFRLLALEEHEHLDEKASITSLTYLGERSLIKKSVLDTYTYPEQEIDLKVGNQIKDENGNSIGELFELNEKNHTLKLKKGPSVKDNHPKTIIKFERFVTKDKQENIINFAEWIIENGFESPKDDYKVTRDLLLNNLPRVKTPIPNYENLLEKGKLWATHLDRSYLPIQGPPGAGKSYTASHIIFDLIQQGKKIGITALSHKVIANLLEKVVELAKDKQQPLKVLYKDSGNEEAKFYDRAKTKDDFVSQIAQYSLVAGTSFVWCHKDLKESVDYLFIDEAGQYALIETLVVSHAAKNIIFLGDHQQLTQPIKGVHPEGTDVSALEHLLQGEKTIPSEKGLFLGTTWRMHPDICQFDSEMFYESRLQSKEELKHQILTGSTPFKGAGLFYKPIIHQGNTNHSPEEIDYIKKTVEKLTSEDIFWNDKNGKQHRIQHKDIKIITPYNANVFELQKEIPKVEIGTVDKFQGQEAPIILYSMASSTAEDAPRGMEFLYSPNRFNVAVSRAMVAFILVGNPELFTPDCQSPEQIKLANPFCRYMEMATLLD